MIAVTILFAIVMLLYCFNQLRAKCLAENPCHIDLDGIADEFLLIGLRPDEDVIGWEAHDPLQFGYAEHPHLDVDDAVQRHETLDFAIAGLSSVVTAIVAPCCFIRQVTSWCFGLVVTVGAGVSMPQGVPFPYCISTNASLSLVVSVGAGASMEWLCPLP